MIKLSANVSKKVPMPDVEYSSQNFSAGMEIEVSSKATRSELEEKFRSLYRLLEDSIQEQIQQADNSSTKKSPGSRGGNGRNATEAQVRAIHAIAGDRGYSDQELSGILTDRFGAAEPGALSIGQASTLIDSLKNNGKDEF
ncbi:MAG: hypothetical protein ACLFWL_17975 [Candidatus Brocadiia bacterium]